MANKRKAILIHQLLPADKNAALSYFSRESIEKVSYCSEGLQIFFKEYNLVKKSIIREKIEVNGLFYKIYPMVTNLTIFKIGPHVTNVEMKNIMQCYGLVIDSYRIQDIVEIDFCKTVSLTDDYRVILDIPEIFANFNLLPIRLPDLTNQTFDVKFFCRLCRCNGHMQFQCQNIRKRSSSYTYPHDVDFFRRPSFEDNSSDLSTNLNTTTSPRSDFCDDLQNSKICSNTFVKSVKEQKCFLNQPCYSKNEFYSKNTTKSCSMKSKSKNYHTTHKVVKNTDVCKKMEVKSSSTSKKYSFETLQRSKSIEKKHCHQKCSSDEAPREIQASNLAKCNRNRKYQAKNQFMFHLSRLLPPNMDLLEVMELLKNASESSFYDISAELKSVLMCILDYNRKRDRKNKILNFIAMLLRKNEQKVCQRKKSSHFFTNDYTKVPNNVEDRKSNSEILNEQTPAKKKYTLSIGIKEAIFMTTGGELEPEFLCNFLHQIRGRKKLLEIASIFTKNFSALASQLMEVQNMYYKHVKRGDEEDRDIRYIERLRQKLLKLSENTTGSIFLKEEADVSKALLKEATDIADLSMKLEPQMMKIKPNMAEIPVKIKFDMTEIPVKREFDMTEIPVKREFDMTEIPVKREFDMTEIPIKRETDMAEISVKDEAEIFMKQTR